MSMLRYLPLLLCALTATLAQAAEPLTVSMKVSGLFAKGYSWQLAIADDGAAKLTVEKPGAPVHESLQIPPARLAELRELLQRERFFDLGASYGVVVPDSSTTTLSVHVGKRTHTVELQYLRTDDPHIEEMRRALRVSIFLRGLFQNPDAVDLRRYDEMLLKDSPK
ncbi:hypothetical protein [Prosthecobacter sp.]|uniref:hypothetical protein n=1 Tax=Prosthecobacter sp. TaxID=1965333 RepID=UPI003782F674